MKQGNCKVCNLTYSPQERFSNGFCRRHYEQFKREHITLDGLPIGNRYFDKDFRIKIKFKKDKLGKIVKDSKWYRKWQKEIKKRANKKCEQCSTEKGRMVVHHEKIRFSEILNIIRKSSDDLNDQLLEAEKLHTIDIGLFLCLNCHAEKHKGEKVYNSLKGDARNSICKICSEPAYCRNFCELHYARYRVGIYDIDGKQLRNFRNEFYIKPEPKPKFIRIEKKCLICSKKHFGLGFCLNHYNDFKIGIIDKTGNILRNRGFFAKSGLTDLSRFITFKGESMSKKDWAKKLGLDIRSFYKRLKKWDLEKALTEPVNETFRRNVK